MVDTVQDRLAENLITRPADSPRLKRQARLVFANNCHFLIGFRYGAVLDTVFLGHSMTSCLRMMPRRRDRHSSSVVPGCL